MEAAVDQADIALNTGNYPVGAAIIVDGEMIAAGHNLAKTKRDEISHAEALLFFDTSRELRRRLDDGSEVEVFSTLAPCIMCLGIAVMHHTTRIVSATKEPRTDIANLDPSSLSERHADEWPSLEFGLMADKSLDLLISYFSKRGSDRYKQKLSLLRAMRATEAMTTR